MKNLLLLITMAMSLNIAIGQGGTMVCNDLEQVSVGTSCEAIITPDMILEGTYADYSAFEVRIYNEMPNPINSPGTVSNPVGLGFFVVGVFEIATGNNCWGSINVMDKMPPQIECLCPEGGLFPAGSTLPAVVEGEFTLTDLQSDIPVDCWGLGAGAFGLEDGDHFYDVYEIEVTSPGTYTFEGTDLNHKFILGVFDAPCPIGVSCGAVIDALLGSFAEPVPTYFDNTAELLPNVKYYVVVSDFDVDYIGKYGFSIIPPAGADVVFAKAVYSDECEFEGCYEEGKNYPFPLPTFSDNCNTNFDWDVKSVEDGPDCGTYIVTKLYTVTDDSGNTASCTAEYFFKGIDISDLEWPINWDGLPNNYPMLECSDPFALDSKGNPHPSHTGYPSGYNDACGTIEVFYNDQVYTEADGVPCGVKVLRYWTVVDDCTGKVYEYIQIIRITDNTAPTFDNPNDIVSKTKAYECNSNVKVPNIHGLSDNCSQPKWWVTSTAGVVVGDINNNGFVDANEEWFINDVPLGDYTVCYHVVDNCGNEDVKCANISVFDGVPPIPVCEQHKQVSVTAMGTAKVHAYSFDSGSFDNCNPVYFKVLRVNDDLEYDGGCPDLNGDDNPGTSSIDVWYDDEVFFCCEDVDNSIMVSMRVFDVDPGLGQIAPSRMLENGDLYGHYNDCWSIVNLECKIPPVLDCPPVTVSCEESLDPKENPRLMPNIVSVCGFDTSYTDKRDLGVCGANIVRTWTATGCNKSTQCKQKITVEATQPFNPCTIEFPADVSSDCASELGAGGEPKWTENPCNVVAAEFKDDTFRFVDDACYKIVREWAVIDWCVYEPNQGSEDNVDVINGRKLNCNLLVEDGYYRYTQILMVTDSESPTITVEDECFATVDCYAYDVELTAHASDECNVESKFNWKYIVTNMDTWETVQYSYNYTPRPLQGKKGNRNVDNLDQAVNASLVMIDPLPIGNYRVTWTVGDGCGNATTENQYFSVADKKAPTPIMVDLATAVMANGMVELKARSFDKGGCDYGCLSSRDNCTEKTGLFFTFSAYIPKFNVEPLKWQHQLNQYGMNFFDPTTGLISTFAKYETGDADAWLAGANTSQRRYLCDYVVDANYTKTVQVYVWDQFAYDETCDDGNYDFVNVEVNFNHCQTNPYPIVSGTVSFLNSTETFEGMILQADNGETTVSTTSKASGNYAFNLPTDSYEIQGSVDLEYLNGVTTLDLVIIQKHLLGLKEIDNPYKLIAADATNNGKISASDLLEFRKVILGNETKFANNSWVAISSDYVFENTSNAVDEAQEARRNNIVVGSNNATNIDFYAVKIGDMNASANALESRNSNSIKMMLDDANIAKGELVEVPFYAKDFREVYGAQFTMDVTNLNVEDIVPGALNISSSNMNIVNNNLVVSWNEATSINLTDGEVLFTLTIRATADVKLSNVLNINDNVARSEIYTGSDLEINAMSLEYRNADVSYTLYQNEPNPFTATTVIGFDLPKASEYTLTVYDITGKIVKTYNNSGEAGYNKVEVSNKEINTTGVLYYRLKSGDYIATKKMIMIK